MTTPLKGLIVGIANDQSIAWGCAQVLAKSGADLAITYLNDKAKPYVEPLAKSIDADIIMPLDINDDSQLEAVFSAIQKKWGKLDFMLHSIAFAPKDDLHGRVTDCSREGFKMAMDISCHSLIRMSRAAEPLMTEGGSIMTMSYYGARKVIANYNMMGPVKAALESSVRYLAAELGSKGIRVNALSPGPTLTRAASGISHFDDLMAKASAEAPMHQLVTIEQIGEAVVFLASDRSKFITGETIHIDGGFNITR